MGKNYKTTITANGKDKEIELYEYGDEVGKYNIDTGDLYYESQGQDYIGDDEPYSVTDGRCVTAPASISHSDGTTYVVISKVRICLRLDLR